MKKARQLAGLFSPKLAKLLLLVSRLVVARLVVTLILLRCRLRLCGIGLGRTRCDRLLIFVVHFMNPLSEDLKAFF